MRPWRYTQMEKAVRHTRRLRETKETRETMGIMHVVQQASETIGDCRGYGNTIENMGIQRDCGVNTLQ